MEDINKIVEKEEFKREYQDEYTKNGIIEHFFRKWFHSITRTDPLHKWSNPL